MSDPLPVTDYFEYLTNIYHIYQVLEAKIKHTYLRDLLDNHSERIKEDLETIKEGLGFEADTADWKPNLACRTYLKYLESIHITNDVNLARIMAHIHVRVLADLSAKERLIGSLKKHGLPNGSWIFPNEDNMIKQIINWINLQATSADALVGDACIAYLSYNSIFA